MARRITRKELLKQDEFVETAADVGQWFERNWKALAGAVAGAIVVVLLIVAWSLNQRSNREEAMKLLSRVRLGICTGRLPDLDVAPINGLFLQVQPAHLQVHAWPAGQRQYQRPEQQTERLYRSVSI